MKRRSSDESGYILVLSIFTIAALLLLGALAIETGHVYIWKLRLDRAAKASTLAGIGYRATRGWSSLYNFNNVSPAYGNGQTVLDFATNLEAQTLPVRTEMEAVFGRTLEAGNLPSQAWWFFSGNPAQTSLITPGGGGFNLQTDEATVDVTLEIPTLFAGKLEFFGITTLCNAGTQGDRCRIRSVQRAALNPATVVLILDTSGSMECDSAELGTDRCACRQSNNPCENRPTQAIKQLKAAVHEFHSFFNPTRDRIAVIPFNLGAEVVSDLPLLGGFGSDIASYQAFKAAIDGLIPKGNTNPCDAFVRANDLVASYKETRRQFSDNQNVRPFFVFFTDGAPNAMRSVFMNVPPGTSAFESNPNLLPHSYQYSIDWLDGAFAYRGPSPLILEPRFNAVLGGGNILSMYNRAIGADGLPVVNQAINESPPLRCGDPISERSDLKYLGSLDHSIDPPLGRERGCLVNTDFQLPFTSGTNWQQRSNYGVARVPFKDSSVAIPYTDQLPYYCTTEAADFARQQLGATVFAVGLGAQAPACHDEDPLQDADNPYLRKDNFLTRVAFDWNLSRNGNTCDFASRYQFSQGRRAVSISPACNHSYAGQTFEVGYTPYPERNSISTPSSRNPSTFPPGTEGEYIPIENSERLRFTFARIAKQILLRLTG